MLMSKAFASASNACRLLTRRQTLIALGSNALLSACDFSTPPGPRDGAQSERTKIKLLLGDQARFTRAKVEAASAFDDAPFDYEWVNFQGAAPLFEALRAGAVDTAPAGDSPVLFAAFAGVPMKIVAVSVGTRAGSSVGIVVPAHSPIQTVADFKGQHIIVSSARGSISQYQLFGALAEVGLTAADVKISFMLPVDALSAFQAGHIGIWATFGTYLAMAEHDGGRIIRDGQGIHSGLGFITASDKALADPAKRFAIANLLDRLRRAEIWTNAHQDNYEQIFASLTNLPADVVHRVVTRELRQLQPVDKASIASLQQVADVFTRENVFEHAIDVHSLFETSVWPSTL